MLRVGVLRAQLLEDSEFEGVKVLGLGSEPVEMKGHSVGGFNIKIKWSWDMAGLKDKGCWIIDKKVW
jgi:hypothetical protein